MSYVELITQRATVPDRPKADKETLDAINELKRWNETQTEKFRAAETLRLVTRALVMGEREMWGKAYAAVSVLKTQIGPREGAAFTNRMELLQSKLLDRSETVPARMR